MSRGRFKRKQTLARLPAQSGQSMVEFAIVLPLLLLLLVGVIDMGQYAYVAILVGNAARAGVAYGSQNHNTAGDPPTYIILAAKNDYQSNGQDPSGLTVTKNYVCGCDNAGTITATDCTNGICPVGQNKIVSLQVTAQGSYDAIFGFPGIPSPLVVTRSAIMRIGA